MSVYASVCLWVCVCVCLSVCLSVCTCGFIVEGEGEMKSEDAI